MKRIRFDYYNYRLKKGRADILLQLVEESKEFCIPLHYVEDEECLCRGFSWFRAEDDGELVLVKTTLNECHMQKSGKVWMPLNKLAGLPLRVQHHIFSFFLELCPREGESGIIRRVEEMLDAVKVEMAKEEYVERLRSVLEGHRIMAFDAYVKQPDPDLMKKEMETLEHFRIHKPHHPDTNQRDGMLCKLDLYSYEPIDWEALGAKFKPMEFPLVFEWDGEEDDQK